LKSNVLQTKPLLGIGQHSDLSLMCQGLHVHDFGMLFLLFMNEDAVVENLFIVLQAHCDRYECKILNVKSVFKYCNECND